MYVTVINIRANKGVTLEVNFLRSEYIDEEEVKGFLNQVRFLEKLPGYIVVKSDKYKQFEGGHLRARLHVRKPGPEVATTKMREFVEKIKNTANQD